MEDWHVLYISTNPLWSWTWAPTPRAPWCSTPPRSGRASCHHWPSGTVRTRNAGEFFSFSIHLEDAVSTEAVSTGCHQAQLDCVQTYWTFFCWVSRLFLCLFSSFLILMKLFKHFSPFKKIVHFQNETNAPTTKRYLLIMAQFNRIGQSLIDQLPFVFTIAIIGSS